MQEGILGVASLGRSALSTRPGNAVRALELLKLEENVV
jgi:hypothetical protein